MAILRNILVRLQSSALTASHQVTLVDRDTQKSLPLVLTHLVDDVLNNSLYYGEYDSPQGLVCKVVVLGDWDKVVAIGSMLGARNLLINTATEAAKTGQYSGGPWSSNEDGAITLTTGHILK